MMCEIRSKLGISTPEAETHPEPSRTSKITRLVVNYFHKKLPLRVWLGSDCASENNVNDVKWDL